MKPAWTIIAAAMLLSACGGAHRNAPADPLMAAGDRITVRTVRIPEFNPVAGEIATRDQAEALVRIGGTLVELRVREGDLVTRGQQIGRVVDSRTGFESRASAAQAAAATAQAEAARAELGRIQYLYRQGVYAKARLDQAQGAASAAEAGVRAARAQQSASAAVVAQGAILAPASGRVLRAGIPAGSVVTPGMSVATITAGMPIIRLDVPQSLARQIRAGAAVSIQDQAGLGERRGTIAQIYPAVTAGRVRVDITVPGLTTDLVGERVSVMLEAGSHPGLLVPRRFVNTRYGSDYVTVVAKDGAPVSTLVQTAPAADPALVEILSGVSAGDVLAAGEPAR